MKSSFPARLENSILASGVNMAHVHNSGFFLFISCYSYSLEVLESRIEGAHKDLQRSSG